MKKSIILILFFIVSSIQAQTFGENFPIAADSTIDEIEPYLTHFWYDGWVYMGSYQNEIESPIWLAYIETDSSNFFQVVAYNFKLDYYQSISISEKFEISAKDTKTKSKPIIENYKGKPVAIWHEDDSSQSDLYYSLFQNSVWSTPAKLTNDLEVEEFANFVSLDNNLNDNALIRISDNNIISNSLDENFNWGIDDTLYSTNNSIKDLKCRYSMNNKLWIAFTEQSEQDSSYMKILIDTSGSTSPWKQFVLQTSQILPTQLQLNIGINYNNNYIGNDYIHITWLEDSSAQGRYLEFKNDSLESEMVYLPTFDANILSSNSFLSEGGCIVDPEPYYFMFNELDSSLTLMSNDGYKKDNWRSDNRVANLSMSGINNNYYILAWSENDGIQSDIFLRFYYLTLGDVQQNNYMDNYRLEQNYPNPFNPTTEIRYTIPESNFVSLKVYNILGEEITTLVSKIQKRGSYISTFDGKDIPSGVYIYTLKSGSYLKSNKMLLLK